MMKSIYSVMEIARILRVSDQSILDAIHNGELKAAKGHVARNGIQQWEITFHDAANYIKHRMYKRIKLRKVT